MTSSHSCSLSRKILFFRADFRGFQRWLLGNPIKNGCVKSRAIACRALAELFDGAITIFSSVN